jgi:branched-chain amino acid transport system permease protein
MSRGAPYAATAALAGALAVLPLETSDYHQLEWARVGVYACAILGLNVLTGYTGQISLGHGAFMAIGGYTAALLTASKLVNPSLQVGLPHVDPLLALPVAGTVAGLAGLVVGIPALRLSGLYLALATFAVAVSVPSLAKRFPGQTGGTTGIVLDIYSGRRLYEVAWSSAAVLFVLVWAILRGRVGRAFRAVRDSEIAAASSGVDLAFYKTLAFGISAACAGVAGALLALVAGFASPDTFPLLLSLTILIGAVVAGLGSLWGVLAGAAFVQFLPGYAEHVSKQAPSVVYGVVLVAIMLVAPTGFAGLLRRALRREGPPRGTASQRTPL